MKRHAGGLLVLALAGLVAWNATSGGGGASTDAGLASDVGLRSDAGLTADAGRTSDVGLRSNVESVRASGDRGVSGRRASGAGLPWFTNWPEAVDEARRKNQLLFVYLGLDPKVCPPCARMERDVFGRADAGRLAERCVLVKAEPRAPGAGLVAESDARSAAFLDGMRVGAAPTIILFNAEGHMLHRQVSRLSATYDRNARVVATAAESLLGLDDLITLVDATARRERREALEMRRLVSSGKADNLITLAGMYRERERYDLALAHLRRSAAIEDDAVVRVRIAETLEAAGSKDEAIEAYAVLVATFPDHPRHNAWRLALTLLRLSRYDPTSSDGLLAEGAAMIELQEIATIAAREQQFGVEDEVQVALGHIYLRRDEVTALEGILDWFERRGDDPTREREIVAAGVRWDLAEIAAGLGRNDLALKHMERLVRDHPQSVQAQRLKHGVLDAMRNG